MAVAMLSAALSKNKKAWTELEKVSGWMKQVLKQSDFISQAAQRYRYIDQTVVLGRGFNYATAFEWALKMKELTYISRRAIFLCRFRARTDCHDGERIPCLCGCAEGQGI